MSKIKFLKLALPVIFFTIIPVLVFAAIKLENPLGPGANDPRVALGKAIGGAMSILGSIALLSFMYGGFMYLTSGGNEERIKKGTKSMLWSALGIVVIFGSYVIVEFIISGALLGLLV